MKESNFGDVGQIRRRSGISMKMMTKAETLQCGQSLGLQYLCCGVSWEINVQADHAKEDDNVEMEDVRNAQCET
jgi:hypothetical protein